MSGESGLKAWLPAAPILLLALVVRGLYLPWLNLDADMAVTGLMARHILEGQFPIFFYGQPFCGTIEAYVAAPVFALFGSSPLTLCFAPILFCLGFVLLAFLVARDMWGARAAWWSGLFAALPPYLFAIHGVLPRAAYIEIPFFSLLLIWLAFRIVHRQAVTATFFVYGLVAGLGFWTHFLIAYALVATALYLVLSDWRLLLRKSHALIWLGFFLGSLPFWAWNLAHEWQSFAFLLTPKASEPWQSEMLSFLGTAAPIILGAFGEYPIGPLFPVVSYLVPVVALAGLGWLLWLRRGGLWRLARLDKSGTDGAELFLLMLLAVVVVTALKGEPVGSTRRHFVPIYVALVPLAGYLVAQLSRSSNIAAVALACLALASNLAGILATSPAGNAKLRRANIEQVAQRQAFIKQLLDKGINRAYGLDYWVCPQLTFESNERLIVVLGGEELDHFYEPHDRLVAQAPSLTWVGRRDSHFLEASLQNMGARFQRLRVGEFSAFYDIKAPQPTFAEVPPQAWRAIAGEHLADAPLAWDRDALTRWSPLAAQRPGQSLVLDLGQEIPDLCMVRVAPGRIDDLPEGLSVYVSRDGQDWHRVGKARLRMVPLFWWEGKALTSPSGYRADLYFKPRPARYVRLEQTLKSPIFYWSLQELRLFRPAPAAAPADPMPVLELALRNRIQTLYADMGLEAFAPSELFPAPEKPPTTPAWPLDIRARDVLPLDPDRVMVAVDQSTGPELLRFLDNQGYAYHHMLLCGFQAVWALRPPPEPGLALSLETAALSSSAPGREDRASDGDGQSRWDTARPRQAGDFFQIDLGASRRLAGLGLEALPAPQDLPLDLVLELSDDGQNWRQVEYQRRMPGPLVFAGDGLLTAYRGQVNLVFPDQAARFLRLSLTHGHARYYWSIYGLKVWEAAGGH